MTRSVFRRRLVSALPRTICVSVTRARVAYPNESMCTVVSYSTGGPTAILAWPHTGIASAVAASDLSEKLHSQRGPLVCNTFARFKTFIQEKIDHWVKVFQTVSVKVA